MLGCAPSVSDVAINEENLHLFVGQVVGGGHRLLRFGHAEDTVEPEDDSVRS